MKIQSLAAVTGLSSRSSSIFTLVLAFLIFYAQAGACQTNNINLTGDVWTVSGVDVAGVDWRGSTLVFTRQVATDSNGNFQIEGQFNWIGNNGSSGGERIEGTFSFDRRLDFRGVSLINPIGITTAIYLAQVTPDGQSIVNGSWSNGIPSNDWQAIRGSRDSIFQDRFESPQN